ncbi:MAG: cell division protein FtsZ [Pseudomonadota bacterium]|nr:cell division protein FtsZ [Pseudomonadota bacterium]
MTINLKVPDLTELKPRITVFGVGGAGGNAVNNMIRSGLEGVHFVVANTDAQALSVSSAERRIQMGAAVTEGLGAGSKPEIGSAAAEEVYADIKAHLSGSHMAFITAGMGGGTGTGAAPVIARASREDGILTVGVVTKPFQFEGHRRMTTADAGIKELAKYVDTLIVIPNQNLFRVATEKTTLTDAFAMADKVLHSGVACITDLMVKEGLINLDFADVKTIMQNMGKAMMGTGEASGEKRAIEAAEAAISNPLLDDVSMKGATGLLISITGGPDLTLYEVDEAASRIREEVDSEANIILGATFDNELEGMIRVSVVATGLERQAGAGIREQAADQAADLASLSGRIAALTPAGGDRRAAQAQGGREQFRGPGDVTIEKRAPQTPARRPAAAQGGADGQGRQKFVPQPPSVARQAPLKMPRVEDFPDIVQNELKARRGELPEIGLQAQKKKTGFFERLKGGLGRSGDTAETDAHQEPVMEAQRTPAARHTASAAADSRARITRTAGTPKTQPGKVKMAEEDELEIPAFLRRQSS